MKTDAISSIERRFVILALDKQRKWTAKRLGATVEMARFKTHMGRGRIYYSVTLRGDLVISARADTVDLAVDDINRIIHGYAVQTGSGAHTGYYNGAFYGGGVVQASADVADLPGSLEAIPC